MTDNAGNERARDPQDLERLLVARQRAGDIDAMAALYEPDAILDAGDGQLMHGRQAIRALFADLKDAGKKFDYGKQNPAVISGELALTSTQLPDGSVTAEVARRQHDGTWLWVIDRFSVIQKSTVAQSE